MTGDSERDGAIGAGFAQAQMARAFVTALTDRDETVRRRAESRVGRWGDVLSGMRDGLLAIGSRTPVRGLPAWVTTEVLHGGFATGHAVAGGPLTGHERAAADRHGLPHERSALFDHHLTDSGMAELVAVLESGRYRVDVPEEAALLAVAALVRAGETGAALDVVDAIRPFADRLRFLPAPAPPDDVPDGVVCRVDAGRVRAELVGRRVPAAILAERETLTVWNPLADAFLALWASPDAPTAHGAPVPDGWRDRARALLDRFDEADRTHRRCRRRRSRGNLATLHAVTAEAVTAAGPSERARGSARAVVRDMVRKRGEPGSDRLAAVRADQARHAAVPTHAEVAAVLVARLADVPPGRGLADVAAVAEPVAAGESPTVPAGTAVPAALRAVMARAAEGTPSQLVARGHVPSAEVLAELTPAVVAARVAEAQPDAVVRRLVAGTERAFAARRSVLLVDMSHQVRSGELPWMAGLGRFARPDAAASGMRDTARELGRLAVEAFPGTLLPNPLVGQLRALTSSAGTPLPWTDELAADIFMRTFSATFLDAAWIAHELLAGTPYALYYGLDPAALPSRPSGRAASGTRTSPELAELCLRRSGAAGDLTTVGNGRVIEQAQILTTHNLATLAGPLDVRPDGGWTEAAHGALTRCRELVLRGHALVGRGLDGRPAARTAAFAWRQMVVLVSLAGRAGEPGAGHVFGERASRESADVPALAREIVDLRTVLDGRPIDPSTALLGWASGPHRLLPAASRGSSTVAR